MRYSKHPAIPSETVCVHWHLMKRSLYSIINIFSRIHEVCFPLCTTRANSPLEMIRREMELRVILAMTPFHCVSC